MKFIDILNNENETKKLFERYKELYNDDYNSLYGDTDSVYLDIIFNGMYSSKTLSNTVELYQSHNYDSVIDFMCFLIHCNCKDKCIAIKELLNTKYNVTDTRVNKTTEKTITSGETQNTSNSENIENTYGYDTENAVKDNSNNYTDTGSTSHNTETTKEITYSFSDKPIQDLIDSEIQRKIKEDLVILTFECYSNILFLEVYE